MDKLTAGGAFHPPGRPPCPTVGDGGGEDGLTQVTSGSYPVAEHDLFARPDAGATPTAAAATTAAAAAWNNTQQAGSASYWDREIGGIEAMVAQEASRVVPGGVAVFAVTWPHS